MRFHMGSKAFSLETYSQWPLRKRTPGRSSVRMSVDLSPPGWPAPPATLPRRHVSVGGLLVRASGVTTP